MFYYIGFVDGLSRSLNNPKKSTLRTSHAYYDDILIIYDDILCVHSRVVSLIARSSCRVVIDLGCGKHKC